LADRQLVQLLIFDITGFIVANRPL